MTFRIDSHVHIFPPWRLKSLVRWILKAYPKHPVHEDITVQEILSDLKSLGITHFFNFIYPLKKEETEVLNRFNNEFCAETSGAIPFCSLHPDTPEKVKYAEQLLFADHFAGFKFHPFVQHFDPWDKRFDSLYRYLEEIKKPVFLHTGFELFYQQKMPVKELEQLVKRYPGLPLVFVHMAFPDFSTCFELMEDYDELYLDATNVLAFLRPQLSGMLKSLPNGTQLLDRLVAGLEKHSHRIMYGSDYPVGMGSLCEIYRDLEIDVISTKVREDLQVNTAFQFINRFVPDFNWQQQLR